MTRSGTCIFINGLPGSGKSTYARKFVESRPGWLNLDVDVLRGLLGTAAVDFEKAGAEVRPLALAVLREHIGAGGNVVMPQLFFTPEESADFEAAVVEAGGHVYWALLTENVDECWRRVVDRGQRAAPGSMDRVITSFLEKSGGLSEMQRMEQQLGDWSERMAHPLTIRASTPHAHLEGLTR